MALLPGLPHRSGLDMMVCSLMAKSACNGSALPRVRVGKHSAHTQAPAQRGVAALSLRPHAVLEDWIMALHRTVVV